MANVWKNGDPGRWDRERYVTGAFCDREGRRRKLNERRCRKKMKRVERRGTLELARAGSQPMMMMQQQQHAGAGVQRADTAPNLQVRKRPISPLPAIASLKEDEGHRGVVVGKLVASPGVAVRMEVDGETDADGEAEVDGEEGDHEEYEIEDEEEGSGRRGAEEELLEAVDAAEAQSNS